MEIMELTVPKEIYMEDMEATKAMVVMEGVTQALIIVVELMTHMVVVKVTVAMDLQAMIMGVTEVFFGH